jgi:hypothetical protein
LRDAFPGRYRPTQDDFERLWGEGLFVPDTNVLLSLYRRYYSLYRTELLSVLRSVKDRLWLPHQVAHEYLKDRLKVIDELRATYAGMREQLSAAREDAATEEAKRLLGSSEAYFADLEAGFPKSSNAPGENELWSAVDELFVGRIGAAYDSEARAKIFEEGKQRYADRIPPGFLDQGKSKDEEKYGDLLLWFQVLDEAEQETRPILFVTNDQKEDPSLHALIHRSA